MTDTSTTIDLSSRPVLASGTFQLGELTVHRLGYGAMQLTGPGVWGEPADRAECVRVLRRAVELGVDLIDTAGITPTGRARKFRRLTRATRNPPHLRTRP